MKILLARSAGFCEGVKKAFKKALKAQAEESSLYMLGHLVHNSEVVKRLKIKSIKNILQVPHHSTLIISAHGAPPDVYQKAKEKEIKIIDTTCAWVKRAQRLVKKFHEEGRQVIIVGDKGHPEVEGLKGWAGKDAIVISKKEGLKRKRLKDKVGIISQTTQSKKNFKSICEAVPKDKKIGDTICSATSKRQEAAIKVARKVEVMLIIGDKKSANTKRLKELSKKTGTPTYQIQTALELKIGHLKNKERVGITAGASTPDWIISSIIEKIKAL